MSDVDLAVYSYFADTALASRRSGDPRRSSAVRRAERPSAAQADVFAQGGQAHHDSLESGLLPNHQLIRLTFRAFHYEKYTMFYPLWVT
jgi:hypothetical protein